ncbi:helix-turn-helix domain-containing protein [Streptomyces sp. NPDC001691]|uniref:helix-turn-helix domain-containing protein n=1 Tax=Streptomyces sp. NPDC001691 TaxID=3364600 RepID=UPI00369A485D
MAAQHLSAHSHTSSPVLDDAPRSGVVHANTRHTSRYTVIGNHLAQHRELSLLAIGLAVHIQSLPAGTRIGIKALAERFPESEARIAAALRELEAHGYLRRSRERLPSGRVVTRTVSCNQPGASHPAPPTAHRRKPVQPSAPPPEPPSTEPPARPTPEPDTAPHPAAAELLARLRRDDPRLLLAERDIRRLAPAVTAWLDRGADPDAVRRTLCANLPDSLRHPASLLAHRLAVLLPPPLPPAPARPDPLQTCETCDRAFRAPEPGHCPGCRT